MVVVVVVVVRVLVLVLVLVLLLLLLVLLLLLTGLRQGEHNTITAVTCTPLGDIFLEAFLVLALVYGVVGLAIQIKAAQAAGRAVDYSKPAQLLPPHVLLLPWGPKWNELLPLVLDGVAFSRSRIAGGGGGGGYSAVAAAPARR